MVRATTLKGSVPNRVDRAERRPPRLALEQPGPPSPRSTFSPELGQDPEEPQLGQFRGLLIQIPLLSLTFAAKFGLLLADLGLEFHVPEISRALGRAAPFSARVWSPLGLLLTGRARPSSARLGTLLKAQIHKR